MKQYSSCISDSTRESKLQSIIENEKTLNEIKDVDILLEQILSDARAIVNADAGSIYVVEDDLLLIKYAQNDTQQKRLAFGEKLPYKSFTFPINDKSIVGYCANHMTAVNIPDVYEISDSSPYKFNIETDKNTGYRSKSMLSIPLKAVSGKLRGVLQLINAFDSAGNIIDFDYDAELFATHFASSATQALDRTYIMQNYLKRMTLMSQFRDPKETFEHVERVSSFSKEIYDRWATNHNLPPETTKKFRDNLMIAAKCHDFGKVGVSDKILQKEEPFIGDDRAIMRGHTCIGAKLFNDTENELDEMCRDVALYHHEWWNGDSEKSYPGNIDYTKFEPGDKVIPGEPLKGENIPLAARIVAVADVFDALSHQRVYKRAWTMEASIEEIKKSAGTQFDPDIVKAFLQIKDRLIQISNSKNKDS